MMTTMTDVFPRCECPLPKSVLAEVPAGRRALFEKYRKDGYCIVDTDVDESLLDAAVADVGRLVEEGQAKKNPKIFHYNQNPRVVEAWKHSAAVKAVALSPGILNLLSDFYGRKPIPFSTINFRRGTEQPLHSDYVHFGSLPDFFLAGVWVALEDIKPGSGPLSIAVGSHKLPIIDMAMFCEERSVVSPSVLKKAYSQYEEYAAKMVEENNLEVRELVIKKGQAIIWAANLLHGAFAITDAQSTRHSQVTHYHFEECRAYYNPLYSNRLSGKYALRNIDEIRIG